MCVCGLLRTGPGYSVSTLETLRSIKRQTKTTPWTSVLLQYTEQLYFKIATGGSRETDRQKLLEIVSFQGTNKIYERIEEHWKCVRHPWMSRGGESERKIAGETKINPS